MLGNERSRTEGYSLFWFSRKRMVTCLVLGMENILSCSTVDKGNQITNFRCCVRHQDIAGLAVRTHLHIIYAYCKSDASNGETRLGLPHSRQPNNMFSIRNIQRRRRRRNNYFAEKEFVIYSRHNIHDCFAVKRDTELT